MSDSSTAGQSGEPTPSPRERADRADQKLARWVRLGLLALVLVAITGFGMAHIAGAKVVGVDALCPFGGIETFWALIASGTIIKRIAVSSIILLVGIVLTAVVFRRAFCGYICPLGAVQEFSGKIGKLFTRGKHLQMPAWLDRPARYLKYAVLAVFTVWTWIAADLVIRPYDPWVAWMHLTSPEVIAEFSVGLAVLGVSVVGSVFYDRFFCKYACPTGAFLGLISRLSIFKVRRNADTCTSCSACDKACPVNVQVSTVDIVDDPECINCNECVNVCPVKDTLTVSAPGAPAVRKSVKPMAAMGAVVGILVLLVGATTLTGAFAWTPAGLAKVETEAGEAGAHEGEGAAAESSGAESGTPAAGSSSTAPAPAAGTVKASDFDVETIRGSMTFTEVSEATGIPASAFEKRFGISESDMGKPMKDLAESKGFDIHTDLREWVKEQLGSK